MFGSQMGSQEPHQTLLQSHHHHLLAHSGQPANMGTTNSGNHTNHTNRHDKSAPNQEQQFVFGQQFSINAHQASNPHHQVQYQNHHDHNSSASQMVQCAASPVASASSSIPNMFENSGLNQRLMPITFGQQSLASASSSLSDTLGLTTTTHSHQLMILQQQQQNQTLHFPISNNSIHDTNFNAAAFLQHQSVANIGVSTSSSHPSIASNTNTTSSSASTTTTFPQIHLQNHHQLHHHHVVTTHNLDNISFASNASKVIIDQTTRNDLLKMHTGSADLQTSFENFSNGANSLCQISNYTNSSVPMNNSDSVIISNSSLIREINNNVGTNIPTYSGFAPCLEAKVRLGTQESDMSSSDIFLTSNKKSSNPINGEINLNFAGNNNLMGPCKSSGMQASSISNGTATTASCQAQTSKGKNNTRRDSKPANRRSQSESPRRIFACPSCKKEFREKFNMKRHMQIHAPSRPKFVCNECSKSFAWKDNFIRHRKAAHLNDTIINSLQPCPIK